MHFITRQIMLAGLALALYGCVDLPLYNEGIDDPALRAISHAYEQTVQAAYDDPEKNWQSGWLGNMWINYSKDRQAGLCYEWKYLVHSGVADTVNKVGWQIRGIAIHEDTPHEHHAVLIFDPARANVDDLLTTTQQDDPVYVLDAWRQGRADIYHLADWLDSPFKTDSPARIFSIKENNVPR